MRARPRISGWCYLGLFGATSGGRPAGSGRKLFNEDVSEFEKELLRVRRNCSTHQSQARSKQQTCHHHCLLTDQQPPKPILVPPMVKGSHLRDRSKRHPALLESKNDPKAIPCHTLLQCRPGEHRRHGVLPLLQVPSTRCRVGAYVPYDTNIV